MAGYRILDIETVVDRRVWTPPAPRYRLAPFGEFTPEVKGKLVEWGSVPAAVTLEDVFPPPHAHRIVAMSWVDLSDEDGKYYHFTGFDSSCEWNKETPDGPERGMLKRFRAAQEADEALLVTWNGRSFDLPVMNLRSLKHKIPASWYYKERDVRYRYTEAGHCDLMDVLGDYGAARSMKLGDMARLIGLPGKQGEVSGAGVADIVARSDDHGEMAKVGDYCLSDAVQTAVIFIRSRFHKGMINAEEHNRAILSFVQARVFAGVFGTGYDPGPLYVEDLEDSPGSEVGGSFVVEDVK